ncbi:cell cycle control protein Cwf15/Cwc15 [Ceratobasidium sp. AG-Ba]|nr:cell cycle control protein Cwf15/Cwc15 [Ceratobasidium sp. AG-Ba]
MSTAHRPTWDPAQAKEVKGGSRQYSSRDMASQTKLKFRQPGQTSVGDVAKRDLRTDLLLAEHEAKNRKRKAAGQDPLPLPPALSGVAAPVAAIENGTAGEDDAATKRRKMLQEVLELDKDDDDEEQPKDKGKGKAPANDEEASEGKARDREAEIAIGNPLLNLEAALGGQPSTTKPGTFAVKKRWDDDVIFKNQATNSDAPTGQFVNDLLRTEFHRKFMAKFIK